MPGRFAITNDPLNDNETAEKFRAIRSGKLFVEPEVRGWCEKYLANIENVAPDYMKNNGLNKTGLVKRYAKPDKLVRIITVLRHGGDDSYHSFQIGNPVRTYINLFLRNVKRRLKLNIIRKQYDKPVDGEPFILYPIHFHPESSTSILAGTYLNEYEVIRNIAFNLPQGVKLYVKDHISAWGYPPIDFYRKIVRLPNVRLLGPNEPTKQLIKASRGIITLTSTVGYEALLLKRRVFLFGHVFYDFHKGVTRVENPSALFSLLQATLARPVDWDDQYNSDFLCAHHHATLPGSLDIMEGPTRAAISAENSYTQILHSGYLGSN